MLFDAYVSEKTACKNAETHIKIEKRRYAPLKNALNFFRKNAYQSEENRAVARLR
jgi:hypothetical protein